VPTTPALDEPLGPEEEQRHQAERDRGLRVPPEQVSDGGLVRDGPHLELDRVRERRSGDEDARRREEEERDEQRSVARASLRQQPSDVRGEADEDGDDGDRLPHQVGELDADAEPRQEAGEQVHRIEEDVAAVCEVPAVRDQQRVLRVPDPAEVEHRILGERPVGAVHLPAAGQLQQHDRDQVRERPRRQEDEDQPCRAGFRERERSRTGMPERTRTRPTHVGRRRHRPWSIRGWYLPPVQSRTRLAGRTGRGPRGARIRVGAVMTREWRRR
jgi:hypothetical protein